MEITLTMLQELICGKTFESGKIDGETLVINFEAYPASETVVTPFFFSKKSSLTLIWSNKKKDWLIRFQEN